jgi:hypothetical protein
MREENNGFILGPYEKGAPACYVDGPDPRAEYELFQEDLERLEPHIEAAMNRVPAFGEVGIKKAYNGAIAYTPDGNPIIGPAAGNWLNGSSKANRPSTCWASNRGASATMRRSNTSSRRMKRPMRTFS